MLKSFLDGFNVTIMAYGQTGSGKTYTMGTAENDSSDPNSEGLIPRFVCDLFDNLENFSKEERLEANVKVSFLEIYGEDVYDLLGDSRSTERQSLPVRENDSGLVFVQGLQDVKVLSSEEALSVLTAGTKNRITASTAMNAGSSRSHAVFTIILDQTFRSAESEDDTTRISSKLTFVDLAGSERIKRTGAEGQRMKEGIQINSGLFNLGQVINGLADDKRIKTGAKAMHIPYRNSKLTHLLKDALGGNSQTLFLACVSPAECNESETYSTLSYARQARNIQNKPVRNMDKHQLEVRRLKYAVKTWMTKALMHMFGNKGSGGSGQGDDDDNPRESFLPDVAINDTASPSDYSRGPGSEIFMRPEVQQYIYNVNEKINTILQTGGCHPSPRKVRLSIMPSPRTRGTEAGATFSHVKRRLQFNDDEAPVGGKRLDRRSLSGITEEDDHGGLSGIEDFQSPEETEKLVSRMIELVHKEKESAQERDHPVSESEEGDVLDKEAIDEVDKEITEKEEILVKLKDAVKGFGAMKQEYESLLHEINALEAERHELEAALEKAKKQEELLVAQKQPVNPVAMERLKERFLKVKEELSRMKSDKTKKESAYKLMQRESKQLESLQRELTKLKEMKISLEKARKSQVQQHNKFKKEQQQKLTMLKKSDVKKQRQMNDLKSELQKKVRVLGNKDREINRIQSKLKAAEEHITHLLRLANKSRQKTISSTPCKANSNHEERQGGSGGTLDMGFVQSSKNMLDNMVQDRVHLKYMKSMCAKKSRTLKDIKEELAEELNEKKSLVVKRDKLEEESVNCAETFDEEKRNALNDILLQLKTCDSSIDRLTTDQNMLNADLAELSKQIGEARDESDSTWESFGKTVVGNLSLSQCQHILWDMVMDKSEALDALREEKEKRHEVTEAFESAQETISQLEKQLEQSRKEMKQRLDDAERQRVQDVWALMKSRDSATVSEASNASAQSVAFTRAQELEVALNDYIASDSEMKAEISQLKSQNTELMKKLQEKLFLGRVGYSSSKMEADDMAKCFKDLDSIWTSLGTNVEDRESVLNTIEKASGQARKEALAAAKQSLESAQSEVSELLSNLKMICGLLHTAGDKYFDEGKYSECSLQDKLVNLRKGYADATRDFQQCCMSAYALKDKLSALITDMGLQASDMSVDLNLLSILDSSHAKDCPSDLASYMIATGINLSASHLSHLESAIRDLSVKRADTISQTVEMVQQITTLRHVLGLTTASALQEVDLGQDCDSMVKQLAIDIVLSPSANITGNVKVVNVLETLSLSLMTMKSMRQSCAENIDQLAATVNRLFGVSLLGNLDDSGKTDISRECLSAAAECMCQYSDCIANHLRDIQRSSFLRATETGVQGEEYNSHLAALSDMPAKTQEELTMLADIEAPITQFEENIMFIDEKWLHTAVCSVVDTFKQSNNDTIFAIVLSTEKRRVDTFANAVRDMEKQDSLLEKHITDMEAFETTSKQNRQKVLMGNSKALMDEEKFRKSGKRKFESICDKLLDAARTAQAHSGGIPLDISKLTPQSQGLLKGKIQERTELMHLHTMTHGARRWSGERDSMPTEDLNKENSVGSLNTEQTSSRSKSPTPSRIARCGPQSPRCRTAKKDISKHSVTSISSAAK
mmetsp:Transcript_22914/g.33487  ORF Transcript_22914/g.33487 Transcript_22914/m.33487 type:complete len:1633 (+) Transcript_22914:1-4899(+)